MRRLSALWSREAAIQMREYESFESALHDSDSYEDPRIVEVVQEKTKRYRELLASGSRTPLANRQTVQNLFVLSYVQPHRPLNVLEVGGACGAAYFESESMLPGRIHHWSIVETPAMVAAGQSFTGDPNLSFHSDLNSAATQLESRDLGIAQGTLQYTADPLRTLSELFALELAYVYVTRTAVTNGNEAIFTKQDTGIAAHGPGKLPHVSEGRSSQPMTLVGHDALIATIPANYEVVFHFDESEAQAFIIGGRSLSVRDIGFLARQRH